MSYAVALDGRGILGLNVQVRSRHFDGLFARVRLQMKIVLEKLLRRLPDMRPAGNGGSDIPQTLVFGRSERLPAEWD